MTELISPSNLSCPLCGEAASSRFRLWFEGVVKLYQCRGCRFVFQLPKPESEGGRMDYSHRYDLDFLKKGKEFVFPHKASSFQDMLKRISIYRKSGDLLDVGCGDGHFLYHAAAMGYRCHGVEESRVRASYAQKKVGAKVHRGFYARRLFPPESFDVISFIQVLEHIPNPKIPLKDALSHLRPGGILMIEVPSIRAPQFLAYSATKIQWFVRPPKGVITPHVNYFSPSTLTRLAEDCGFDTLDLQTGRWSVKYSGFFRYVGSVLDGVMNRLKIGGLLYFGVKPSS